MKRTYLTPEIRIKSIESEAILDESLPLFDEKNSSEEIIEHSEQVLTGSTSVWDEE